MTRYSVRSAIASLACAALSLIVSGGVAEAQVRGVLYDGTSWTLLDAPGAVWTSPEDIGGDIIVGYYSDGSAQHGFRYHIAQGVWEAPFDMPGMNLTALHGIDGDDVVGICRDATGTHGCLHDGTTWTLLDRPGATATRALGIDGGTIVGWTNDTVGSGSHGFIYDGTWRLLDVPGSVGGTNAWEISGTNVVGDFATGSSCHVFGVCHAYLYDGTSFTTLDFPGAGETAGRGIDGGNIVGFYRVPPGSGTHHGFLYDGTTWTTLDAPGASWTALSGIDGSNIVGVVSGNVPQHEIDVAPLALDFGDVALPGSSTLLVTISNVGAADLRLDSVELEAGSSPDFAITAAPALPLVLPAGESEDVEITYTPTSLEEALAQLEVRSNDADERLVMVDVWGTGVPSGAPPAEQIAVILDFIETSVAEGTLQGSGPGRSGPRRLARFTRRLEAAGFFVERGRIEVACARLGWSLARADGEVPPPDFVEGEARELLALLIENVRESLGCN